MRSGDCNGGSGIEWRVLNRWATHGNTLAHWKLFWVTRLLNDVAHVSSFRSLSVAICNFWQSLKHYPVTLFNLQRLSNRTKNVKFPFWWSWSNRLLKSIWTNCWSLKSHRFITLILWHEICNEFGWSFECWTSLFYTKAIFYWSW
jgi:hypothetical protein